MADGCGEGRGRVAGRRAEGRQRGERQRWLGGGRRHGGGGGRENGLPPRQPKEDQGVYARSYQDVRRLDRPRFLSRHGMAG
jgi:hypothetical protein